MSTTLQRRPQASDYKPMKDLVSLDEAVAHPEVVQLFQNALGKHFDAVQYLATIRGLTRENDLFKKADFWEVLRAAMDLAELGLRPNTPFGHAWIIPREDRRNHKVTLTVQLGYQGLLELAWRSGMLESFHADTVYEGDEFSYEYGSNAHLRHVPRGSSEGRRPINAYAYAKLKGGGEGFVVWPYEDVMKIRDSSDAYQYALSVKATQPKSWEKCVWVAHKAQMVNKTMAKQLLKWLPRSSEHLVRAAHIDSISEAGIANYDGARGDLTRGVRELPFAPSTTLEDLGLKTTVPHVEPVPRDQSNVHAMGAAQSTRPPASMPTKAKPLFEMIELLDEHGHIIDRCISAVDWAKMYVSGLMEITTGPEAERFVEFNANNLAIVLEDSEAAEILRPYLQENRRVDLRDEEASEGNDINRQDQEFPLGSLTIQKPAGRVSEGEILGLFNDSLAAVQSAEMMSAWVRDNTPAIQSFGSALKMKILRAQAGRSRELGIKPGEAV